MTIQINDTSLITPEKYYPLARRCNGRIYVPLPNDVAKRMNLIYVFKKNTGERLIGFTTQRIRKRLYPYHSNFNNPRKSARFYLEVRKNPEDFSFGILYQATQEDDLSKLERTFIIGKQSFVHGYNQNRGGGGSSRVVRKLDFGPLPEPIPLKERKSFPLQPDLTVAFTPKTARMKNVIYSWEKKDGRCLIGKTRQTLRRRTHSYLTQFRHPESDGGSLPLPNSVRKAPTSFSLRVLYHGDENTPLSPLERKLIAHARKTSEVYNQNGGGGGSH